MWSKYYTIKARSDGYWYIAGSMDKENWYYLYEHLFKFPSEEEGLTWLLTEGYTPEEIATWIEKNVVVQHVLDTDDTMTW